MQMRGRHALGSISDFLSHMNWEGLWSALLTALGALLCLTVHELCHGLVAYRLGDPTAKEAGRLTLNPIKHIDPLGLLLMITAKVGWAKPVPIDPRNFQRPKQGMAITALAGPISNFLLAWLFLAAAGGILRLQDAFFLTLSATGLVALSAAAQFLVNAAVLSAGLGIFNCIPIPPLDGSKVLFSFLPDRAYFTVLRYERYIMFLLLAVVWLGALDKPLTFLITNTVNFIGFLSAYPAPLFS